MFQFSTPNIPEIDATDVKRAIDAKEDIILLDVRTTQEFAKSRIAGSISIPVDEIEKNVEKIIPDKQKTIYVYCLSGSRSTHAVEAMVKLGYSHVYSMKSGLLSWRIHKYPTI